jgi:hypothetical protein
MKPPLRVTVLGEEASRVSISKPEGLVWLLIRLSYFLVHFHQLLLSIIHFRTFLYSELTETPLTSLSSI